MKLRGIEFGNVLGASGVQGFFGEGYWFDKIPFRKPDFTGMTFVSKTATLYARQGNVKEGIKERFFPSWARVKPFSGHTLNAMGLPNLGIKALLETGQWQQRQKPFFISVMAVSKKLQDRLSELRCIVDLIENHKNSFKAPFGLQINRSCPNTDHHIDVGKIVEESEKSLEIAHRLGIPLMEKFAIDTAPTEAIKELQHIPYCDSICVSNTIKFGWPGIDWQKTWGSTISPLAHLNGGGLSGPALFPHVCRWISDLRAKGFKKPINGGGGIFTESAAWVYSRFGASSIFVGTVARHHPRRVRGIIELANRLDWPGIPSSDSQ